MNDGRSSRTVIKESLFRLNRFCPNLVAFEIIGIQTDVAKQKFPTAIPLTEQIGVTNEDMNDAFGDRWVRTLENTFPELVVRKYGGKVIWVSVVHLPGTVNEEGESVAENGTPDNDTIVTTDLKIATDALRRSIERGATMLNGLADQYQWDKDYLADCLLGIKVMTRSGVAEATAARKSVPAWSMNVLGAAKKGSTGPKKCWEMFGEIASLLRTTRKLTSDEEKELLELVESFFSAYESIGISITIKAHMLVHLLLFLKEYGPPGLFAEDSVEALHAVVNELGRRYAALDHAKKFKQTVFALRGRKMVSNNDEKKKAAATKVKSSDAGTSARKRKPKQGSGQVDGSNTSEATAKAIAEHVSLLTRIIVADAEDGEGSTGPRRKLPMELYRCRHCSDHLEDDVNVPVCFTKLHELLYHTATEDKLYSNKKAKVI